MSTDTVGLTSRDRAEVCANFPCRGRAGYNVKVKDDLKIRLCDDCLRRSYPESRSDADQTRRG